MHVTKFRAAGDTWEILRRSPTENIQSLLSTGIEFSTKLVESASRSSLWPKGSLPTYTTLATFLIHHVELATNQDQPNSMDANFNLIFRTTYTSYFSARNDPLEDETHQSQNGISKRHQRVWAEIQVTYLT